MENRNPSEVFVCEAVQLIEQLHPYVFTDAFRSLTIGEQIDLQARSLVTGCAAGDRAVVFHVRSWFPGAAHRSERDILEPGLSLEDARTTMAREHGYRDWTEVEGLGRKSPDLAFERAVDALVTGDLPGLKVMLEAGPGLVRERSAYGHGATLLHYIGANGVESYRQRTPLNAAEIARVLIAHGADVEAEARMYGGGQTTLDLLLTSAHPAQAGVTAAVAAVLRDAMP